MIQDYGKQTGLRGRLLAMTALAGVAAAAAIPAGPAQAAGFALKEQSASAQGNSFAGATAGAEDISYMFFNPAGLTRQEGSQAEVVLTYIMPTMETTNANGGPIGGSASSGDAAEDALVPAVYAMWSASDDLKVGLGINAPFGLSTKYDPTWAGRLYAIESAVEAININPMISYRLSPQLSVGVGVQAQTMEVTLSQDVSGGGAIYEVTGDDWGYGFNLGLLYEISPQTRLGAAYRSQVAHTISGDASLTGAGSTTAEADLTTPQSASFGLYHDVNDQFAVMAEAAWTGWSSFDKIQIDMAPSIVTGALGTTTISVPEDWEDVWFFALGGTWKASDDLTIRAGIAHDQSPVPDATRTPRLPDADRTWLSLGAKYEAAPNFTINAGYSHIFVNNSKVDITLAPAPNLTADFEASTDIFTVSGTLRF